MSADLLTQVALFVGAIAAFFVWAARRSPPFWIVGFAFAALSVDEAFGLHERVGRWFHETGIDTRAVQDMDSVVLAGYGLIVGWVVVSRWRTLTAAPLGTLAMGGAFALGGAAVAMDMFVPRSLPGAHGEEYLEAGAACLFAGVFVSHAAVVAASVGRRLAAGPGDVLSVLDDVPYSHAFDDPAEGPGHASG